MRKIYFLLLTVLLVTTSRAQSIRTTNILVGASPFQDSMWTINLADYSIVRRLSPSLSGFTITGITGLATHPLTGVHYAILKLSGVPGRVLGTIDVQTGVCTQIGNLGANFSTLTFNTSGTLFGVVGDGGGPTAEQMFTINTTNATTTFYRALGNGADGEVITFNPDDNYFYHWSGNGTVVWERFQNNLDPIQPLTTPVNGEVFGALYAGSNMIWVSNISSTIRFWDIPSQTAGPILMNTPDDLRGLVRETCISSIVAAGPTTVCSPGTVSLSVSGGTGNYQWYQDGLAIGGANASSYTASASGVYNCIYTDVCGVTDSTSVGITVTIVPTPDVNSVSNQTVCNGSNTAAVNFSGSVPGTVFSWTNNNTAIGLGASGTGNIASFTGTNATNAPIVGTITVTPTYSQTTSVSFNYDGEGGSMQTWTVPAGVTSVNIQAWGGQGANGTGGNGGASGGLGGYATGNLSVTPGQVLNIFVGASGSGQFGGFNGGGSGGGQVGPNQAGGTGNGGGGGGASDVRVGGVTLADRIIVAGGGGGGGASGCESTYAGGTGGGGGGVSGGNGVNSPDGGGGQGGSLGSGGNAGIGCGGFLGNPGTLPNGGDGQACCCFSNSTIPAGGGGGGGYVQGGGGGGGSAGTVGCSGNNKGGGGGGAGGSSYIGGVTGGSMSNAVQTGHGLVVITYSTITCTGTSTSFTITVNPTPTVNPVSNVVVCNGAATAPINFSGSVPGTIFQWTNSDPSIGLAASGTGNIGSFIATNPGVNPVTATITVTPTTNSAVFSQTFNFTGAVQSWVVPAGVTSVNIQAFGAEGNRNAFNVAGGLGGSASGTLAVAPGNTLYIYAGGGGTVSTAGGFNGGGNAGTSPCATARGGGGGGASDVRLNVNALANRVLVAAGGAGSGGNRVAGCGRGTGGGGGGGYYGGGGGAGWPGIPPGQGPVPTGGTQVAGGAAGISTFTVGNNGFPGSLGQGGNGGNEVSSNQAGSATAPSGGGNGGGLTGSPGIWNSATNFTGQSGAGGSSYIGGVAGGSTSGGVRSGNGAVTISYTLPITPVICTGTSTTFTITVNPTPTITCPANITVNSQPGICGAVVNYPPATATGVPAPTITYSQASGTVFPVGTTTVTATATNACGTASCTFTITVIDVEPPVITCPAPIVVSNDPNLCSAVVNYTVNVTDNCQRFQVPNPVLPHGAGAITVAGNNLRGGFYFNLTNNSGTPKTIKSFMVRFGSDAFGVVSSPAPVNVYVTTSATTYVGNQANAAAWTTIGTNIPVTVGGPNSEFSLVPLPGNGFTLAAGQSKGVYLFGTVSSLVYNNAANSSFTPISNGVLTLTPGQASSGLFVPALSPRTPNVVINYITLIQTAGLPPGSTFPVGTTVNAFVATDDAGNSSTCSFPVTVNDTQLPTVTCPGNITVTTPVGSCTAVVNYTVTATDNCPGVVTVLVSGPASGSAFPIGTTTVVWRSRDAAGNLSPTCSFTVTVLDAQLPVISQQPVNRTACAGDNVSFSVVSSNALTYQWQIWNGSAWVNIAGATSSTLTLNGVTVSMNTNTYRVLVIGLCSTVPSGTASLYVNPIPNLVLVSSIPPILLPTQTLILTAQVSPAGGTFVWRKNGNIIVGATGATLGPLGVDDVGSYQVTYTDPNGCVAVSNVIVVTAKASDNCYIYPNPNFGQFQVRYYNQPNEKVTVRVFDSKSSQVFEESFTTTTPYSALSVDLGNNSQGSYLVAVYNSAGQIVCSKVIVVIH